MGEFNVHAGESSMQVSEIRFDTWVSLSIYRIRVVTDFQRRVTEPNINLDLVVDGDDRF